jgi:hypothetical protein
MSDVTGTYYAAEDSIQGYGGQVEIGNGASPEVFEAIAAVKTLKFGETKTADVDRTHLRSLNAHKEHAPGMRDTSAFEITGPYLPTARSLTTAGGGSGAFSGGGLPALAAARTVHNFKVVCADTNTTTIEFRAYVAGFSLSELQEDGTVMYTATFMPTQAIDLP